MDRRRAAEVLHVSDTADAEEIRRAFRAAMRKAHPDRGGSAELVGDLVDARRVLTALADRHACPSTTANGTRRRVFHRRRAHRWWQLVVGRREKPVVNRRVI